VIDGEGVMHEFRFWNWVLPPALPPQIEHVQKDVLDFAHVRIVRPPPPRVGPLAEGLRKPEQEGER
jgi:hypothetical protein